MNGAIGELAANAISPPIRKRAINMGISHHLFVLQKKESISPTIPKR
jgi:hypothetical protein